MSEAVDVSTPPSEVIYRHRLATRLTHWVNVLCVLVLLLSGLNILNAHPAFYWGQSGADHDTPIVAFQAFQVGDRIIGRTSIGALRIETTGVLGASRAANGEMIPRGFPSWLTLPSYNDLATARRWHFFFAWLLVANGALYLAASLFSGHFKRDLLPTKAQLQPSHIVKDIADHARLRLPRGEAAKHYNVLQKLAYLGVIVLLAVMVLTGLTMSPGVNAALPFLLDLFGGRQSARFLHFVSASLIVAFVVVHVVMVFLAGPINEIRSMITGRYAVPPETRHDA